ncbi:MAG: mannose-6-phosphate isomerase, class I [Ilumatobacteraceae bacterium]
MRTVHGVVQHYAWGDPTFIPRLLHIEPDGRPFAEIWFGTHQGGPGSIAHGGPLETVSGRLPYLLKVLAAAEPLSLQTHPTRRQAEEGYAREERDGPTVDARTRIYRDPYPKPELLCALTPFDALCGFRPLEATMELLLHLGAQHLIDEITEHGLSATVEGLYRGTIDLTPTLEACRGRDEPEAQLAHEMALHWRADPSAVVTLLLNRVMLEPGEAIFLGPGNLHAYVRGAGVEIMGASDNVVRGGMTSKHVDVDQLLSVVNIEPLAEPRLRAVQIDEGQWYYPTVDTPFRLWRWDVDGGLRHTASGRELLLCTEGDLKGFRPGEVIYLAPDEAVDLLGKGTVFRVEETGTG